MTRALKLLLVMGISAAGMVAGLRYQMDLLTVFAAVVSMIAMRLLCRLPLQVWDTNVQADVFEARVRKLRRQGVI